MAPGTLDRQQSPKRGLGLRKARRRFHLLDVRARRLEPLHRAPDSCAHLLACLVAKVSTHQWDPPRVDRRLKRFDVIMDRLKCRGMVAWDMPGERLQHHRKVANRSRNESRMIGAGSKRDQSII